MPGTGNTVETVAAGHGAGCGLKPVSDADEAAGKLLQPVMGPAVD